MEDNEMFLTSQQWEKIYRNKHRIIITDPEGWDTKNHKNSFNIEKINEEEFKKRLSLSKVYDISNKKNS